MYCTTICIVLLGVLYYWVYCITGCIVLLGVLYYWVYCTTVFIVLPLPKHPPHNAVFDNKYMKLFDARPSAICAFSLRMKPFLTDSNI